MPRDALRSAPPRQENRRHKARVATQHHTAQLFSGHSDRRSTRSSAGGAAADGPPRLSSAVDNFRLCGRRGRTVLHRPASTTSVNNAVETVGTPFAKARHHWLRVGLPRNEADGPRPGDGGIPQGENTSAAVARTHRMPLMRPGDRWKTTVVIGRPHFLGTRLWRIPALSSPRRASPHVGLACLRMRQCRCLHGAGVSPGAAGPRRSGFRGPGLRRRRHGPARR